MVYIQTKSLSAELVSMIRAFGLRAESFQWYGWIDEEETFSSTGHGRIEPSVELGIYGVACNHPHVDVDVSPLSALVAL